MAKKAHCKERTKKLDQSEKFSDEWYAFMEEEGLLNMEGEYYLTDGEWISAELADELGLI